MKMTPIEYYRQQVHQGLIAEDAQQLLVLQQLQTIYDDLLREQSQRRRWFFLRKPQAVRGAYLWGGVGIGKTLIMDCFYFCLPFANKQRIHFHQFMKLVHQELRKHQGEENPLAVIAEKWSRKTYVLCFDELVVSDIADAMILAGLFESLMDNGVCLVMTSNSMPDDLYKNGLQRKSFLPAIAMLKNKLQIIHVPMTTDYRLRHLKNAGVFYYPNDEIAAENMEKSFALLSSGEVTSDGMIELHDRSIPFRKKAADEIWFDFNAICTPPRSQQDYLTIAEKFKTVFVSDIPHIPNKDKNTVLLLIRMIDVFYDAKIRLVCSSAQPINKIYTGDNVEFQRTQSRLQEMQSENYFLRV